MNRFLFVTAIFLLLATGLFAKHGRVLIDFTYDEENGVSNMKDQLVSYYDRHRLTYDTIDSRINTIKIDQRIDGKPVLNIRASEIEFVDGGYQAVVTYDEVAGPANQKYLIREGYDPKAISYQSVFDRVQRIKQDLKLFGVPITNLKVGDIKEVTSGYRAEISYDELNGTPGRTYHIDSYYDPKLQSRNIVEDQIMDIQIQMKVFGVPITNLKVGDIKEVPGGFAAYITYDEVNGKSNMKLVADDFYDPKLEAQDTVHDQVEQIGLTMMINGVKITNLKSGDIKDVPNAGKFAATVTYDEVNGKSNMKYTVESFYDPVGKATDILNKRIETIKRDLTYNGVKIRNLRFGKIVVD